LVHETLSTSFDETVVFDEVAGRALSALVEAARSDGRTRIRFEGRFGRLRAEDATSLSLALTELVQNAIEHGLGAAAATSSSQPSACRPALMRAPSTSCASS
jgi:two-component sensor histidine kinase